MVYHMLFEIGRKSSCECHFKEWMNITFCSFHAAQVVTYDLSVDKSNRLQTRSESISFREFFLMTIVDHDAYKIPHRLFSPSLLGTIGSLCFNVADIFRKVFLPQHLPDCLNFPDMKPVVVSDAP